MTHPEITLVYDDGWPNVEAARNALRTALLNPGMAVLVDGPDVAPSGLASGPTCRTYTDAHGRRLAWLA